ncbi:MAG TPA: hypothetical protein VHY20_12115 [Pirellulales bacterium]|jgi:hypothetical protein|nr:hypothetical protein [Pirellulales bacterium]
MLFVLMPLVRLRDCRWLEKNANALAVQLTAQVTPTLSAQVLRMSRSEARGYVRAKSTPVIEAALEQIASVRPALQNSVPAAFIQRLAERIIRLALDDVAHGQVLRTEQRRAA